MSGSVVGLAVTMLWAATALPVATSVAVAAAATGNCADLAGVNIPASAIGLPTRGAAVTAAALKPGTGTAVTPANFVPEFCQIDGVINNVSDSPRVIHFRVVVPTQWNGNAIQVGGNGFNGFVPRLASFFRGSAGSPQGPAYPPNRPYPIAQGYALYGSDSGHMTGAGNPPGWTPNSPDDGGPPKTAAPAVPGAGAAGGPPPGNAFDWMGDKESLENYAHAQIKKTHDVALALIRQLRGHAPTHTYFMGESQGGRDALMAAGVYGADYDGVLVSVPLSYFTGLLVNGAYLAKLQFDRAAWLPPPKEPALTSFVVAQCDSMDGLADGVINNYLGCYRRFDASVTPHPFAGLRCANGADTGNECFSDAQIGTLEKIFAPMSWGFPMRNGETDWPGNAIAGKGASDGTGPGVGTGLMSRFFPRDPPDPAKPTGQPVGMMYGLILGDPQAFDYYHKSHAELQPQIQAVSAILDAPVDWSKLLGHGGKLIFHSAGNDLLTNSRSHQRVYETAVLKHGQAAIDRAVRFYVTPNGDHGSRGVSSTTGEPTPRYMDLVGALTDWVEQGKTPPDALEQTLMQTEPPYMVTKSRPLCRYPRYPHYRGGDPNRMQSYECRMPELPAPATGVQKIGEAVQRHINLGEVPGAVVLVAKDGRQVWLEARGKSGNGANAAALQQDTIFWAASMTKPLVATAVMMMVEAGKVNLDDPVSKFIPDFAAPRQVRTLKPGSPPPNPRDPNAPKPQYDLAPAARAITVKDLLTHTSGLQTIGVPNDSLSPIAVGDTVATHIPRLASATLEFQPGTRWAYSNATGFDVLVRIVEVASGQNFYDFLRQRILDPLGMKSTSLGPRAEYAARTQPIDPNMLANPCVNAKTYACGSAGLWSSAEDYGRFAQMLLNGGELNGKRLLKRATVEQMSSNQTGTLFAGSSGVPGADRGVGFGLSMIVVQDHDKAGLAVPNGSFGWDGVGTRRFWVVPARKTVIVMLVPGGNAVPLHRDVERAAIDAVGTSR